MKLKRDVGVTTRGASSSSSSGGHSTGATKPKKTASKEVGKGKKPRSSKTEIRSANMRNLTAIRMAHIIEQLNNKRGSTMDSIRSKLIRSGFKTNTSLIRNALERAVKSGLLREIREERFSLPSQRRGSNTNSSSTTSSRTSVKMVRKVASKGQQPRRLSESSQRLSRRRQRRPPQGRRLANSESATNDDEEGSDTHDDDDTGAGEGDVEAESNGSMAKNPSSRVSVAEPVAGCDAIMVFGTH